MSQNERIFFIFNKLGADGHFRASDVYNRFKVGDRTVKRDIAFIRKTLNMPIEWDGIKRAYTIPGINLEDINTQLLLSISVIQGSLDSQGIPAQLSSLISSDLLEALPPEYRILLERMVFLPPKTDSIPPKMIKDFSKTIGEPCLMEFDYPNRGRLCVEPKRLICINAQWQVLSYQFNHPHPNLEMFALAEISNYSFRIVLKTHDVESDVQAFLKNLGV